ncbi:putative kinetochore protein Ndc80 [Dioscorea sansibarensis]
MRGGGGGGGGGRRRIVPRVSNGVSELPMPFDSNSFAAGRRDSDASLCSSRPSSVGGGRGSVAPSALLTDRASQSAALRSVNSYLSSLSAPCSLKPPLPSAREITETLKFLLSRLDFPFSNESLDDDLLLLLRLLRCPIKLPRSALKAPGTPHSWPPLLSALHWLCQLARYSDFLSSCPSDSPSPNDLLLFLSHSYSLFISGDDDAVSALDAEYLQKAEHQAKNASSVVDSLQKECTDLEEKLRALTSGPSRRQALESEKGLLTEDVNKFRAVVDSFGAKVASLERSLGDWERELVAKEGEIRRMKEENEELRKRVDGQAVSARDAERMRREMQAVERNIAESENGLSAMEERALELEASAGRKFKEMEALAERCNQAIRKLKLGNDFQYVLSAEGSSPSKVLGIDYKTTVKPALNSLAEDMKKSSLLKLEELIALQQQTEQNTKILEEKKDQLAGLQSKIEEYETKMSLIRKAMEDHASACAAEAEKIKAECRARERQLETVEKEAEEFLRDSERKLEFAVKESDEETQVCAHELLALIDMVSKYKEYMESTISKMKTDLSETTNAMAEAYKISISAKLSSADLNLGHNGLKRARQPSN